MFLPTLGPQIPVRGGPLDAKHGLVHVDGPQVAGALSGMRGELPAPTLLVVAQLVDGPPNTVLLD